MVDMTINEQTLKGKWREIKGEVQKAWGKLTDDELEKTKGDMNAIAGLIQQRYGDAQEASSEKLSRIFDRYAGKKDEVMNRVKENLKH